jgi:hypothetical protein
VLERFDGEELELWACSSPVVEAGASGCWSVVSDPVAGEFCSAPGGADLLSLAESVISAGSPLMTKRTARTHVAAALKVNE